MPSMDAMMYAQRNAQDIASGNTPKRTYANNNYSRKYNSESELDLLNKVCTVYKGTEQSHQQRIKDTIKNFATVAGKSLSATELAEYAKHGITPVRINIVLKHILKVLGMYKETSGRMMIKARKDAYDWLAETGTELLDYNSTMSSRDQQIQMAFAWAVISELGGFLEVYKDTDVNPLGEVMVRYLSGYHVRTDRAYPLSEIHKHRFIIKHAWKTADQIAMDFPKKADEVLRIWGDMRLDWEMGHTDWNDGLQENNLMHREMFLDMEEGLLKVIEMQERRVELKTRYFDMTTGLEIKTVNMGGMDVKIDDMKKQYGNLFEMMLASGQLGNIEKMTRKEECIYTHTTLGEYMILQSVENEVQEVNGKKYFSIFPLVMYDFGDGNNFGMAGQLIPAQNEVIKERTALLQILHTQAFSGWMYDADSLEPAMKTRIEQHGSAAGLNIEVKPGMKYPEQLKPPSFPSGIVEKIKLDMGAAEEITALGPGDFGTPDKGGESGILLQTRLEQTMKTLIMPFESANEALEPMGKYILNWYSKILTPGRVMPYTDIDGNSKEFVVPEWPLDFSASKIVFAKVPKTETLRMQQLAMWQGLLQVMPPELVPWHEIFELTDVANKDRVVEFIKQRMGLAPAQQQQIAGQLQQILSGGGMPQRQLGAGISPGFFENANAPVESEQMF